MLLSGCCVSASSENRSNPRPAPSQHRPVVRNHVLMWVELTSGEFLSLSSGTLDERPRRDGSVVREEVLIEPSALV